MTRSDGFVCLDFTLDRVAVLEVAGGKVTKWTVRPVVPGSLRGGDPSNPDQLADDLRSALAHAGITARKARIALSDDAVVVKMLDVPSMPQRHLEGAVGFLAEQETPIPPSRSMLGWDIIERRQGTQRVYLAAAWKDVIARLVQVATKAGLEPNVVEPRSLAVSRALGKDQAIVLDAGQTLARLTYVSKSQAPYTAQVAMLPGGEWDAASRLLSRAPRGHGGDEPPVLLAGELEEAALVGAVAALPVAAEAASSALNGHGPARPSDMLGGALLGPLGLAMRGLRLPPAGRFPEVNLLAGPNSQGRSQPGSPTGQTQPRSRRRPLLITATVVGAVVVWVFAGAAIALLLGWQPHLRLGP
jgi:hypothetical protein